MAEYESVLKFDSYTVDKINFNRNDKFEYKNKPIKIDFGIKKSKIVEDDKMIIKLYIELFKDAEENNYPFEMSVDITGYFTISDPTEKINFEPNAIAILYPYIRSIVSTYTVNANIGPIILPAINVNEMIKKEQEDKDKKD